MAEPTAAAPRAEPPALPDEHAAREPAPPSTADDRVPAVAKTLVVSLTLDIPPPAALEPLDAPRPDPAAPLATAEPGVVVPSAEWYVPDASVALPYVAKALKAQTPQAVASPSEVKVRSRLRPRAVVRVNRSVSRSAVRAQCALLLSYLRFQKEAGIEGSGADAEATEDVMLHIDELADHLSDNHPRGVQGATVLPSPAGRIAGDIRTRSHSSPFKRVAAVKRFTFPGASHTGLPSPAAHGAHAALLDVAEQVSKMPYAKHHRRDTDEDLMNDDEALDLKARCVSRRTLAPRRSLNPGHVRADVGAAAFIQTVVHLALWTLRPLQLGRRARRRRTWRAACSPQAARRPRRKSTLRCARARAVSSNEGTLTRAADADGGSARVLSS
jgi:hypothetical protein